MEFFIIIAFIIPCFARHPLIYSLLGVGTAAARGCDLQSGPHRGIKKTYKINRIPLQISLRKKELYGNIEQKGNKKRQMPHHTRTHNVIFTQLLTRTAQEQKAAKAAVRLPFQHQGQQEPADAHELFLNAHDDEEGEDPDADLDV